MSSAPVATSPAGVFLAASGFSWPFPGAFDVPVSARGFAFAFRPGDVACAWDITLEALVVATGFPEPVCAGFLASWRSYTLGLDVAGEVYSAEDVAGWDVEAGALGSAVGYVCRGWSVAVAAPAEAAAVGFSRFVGSLSRLQAEVLAGYYRL